MFIKIPIKVIVNLLVVWFVIFLIIGCYFELLLIDLLWLIEMST
jgi:hypothetical protein